MTDELYFGDIPVAETQQEVPKQETLPQTIPSQETSQEEEQQQETPQETFFAIENEEGPLSPSNPNRQNKPVRRNKLKRSWQKNSEFAVNLDSEPEKLMESQRPCEVKRHQQYSLVAIIAVSLMALYFGYHLVAGNATNNKVLANKETSQEKFKIANPADKTDPKSVFIERIQNQLTKTEKDNQQLSQKVNDLHKTQEQWLEQEKTHEEERQQLQHQLNDLKQQIQENRQSNLAPENTVPNDNTGGVFNPINNFANNGSNQNHDAPQEPQIRIDKLNFGGNSSGSDSQKGTVNKTAVNYVPSGTFVKAIMLGGADVAAGAMSQSDPSPMLFRILENGTLPNHRSSSLRNCVVTAAVIGDISSETGKIRLERMSCTRSSGKVIDIAVEGTVFGSSGKNGIRGTPVWREGTLLQRAFVAGALSGISSGMSQKYTTSSISPLGATQSINNQDIFRYGAAQGMGKAMDRLAEYNIKRAEQYHPVIQLSAGAIVDVVFLKGFFLTENSEQDITAIPAKETSYNQQTQVSQLPASSLQSPIPQPLTPLSDNNSYNDASYQAAQNSLQRMKGDA